MSIHACVSLTSKLKSDNQRAVRAQCRTPTEVGPWVGRPLPAAGPHFADLKLAQFGGPEPPFGAGLRTRRASERQMPPAALDEQLTTHVVLHMLVSKQLHITFYNTHRQQQNCRHACSGGDRGLGPREQPARMSCSAQEQRKACFPTLFYTYHHKLSRMRSSLHRLWPWTFQRATWCQLGFHSRLQVGKIARIRVTLWPC
jgi:hypothetical protein